MVALVNFSYPGPAQETEAHEQIAGAQITVGTDGSGSQLLELCAGLQDLVRGKLRLMSVQKFLRYLFQISSTSSGLPPYQCSGSSFWA